MLRADPWPGTAHALSPALCRRDAVLSPLLTGPGCTGRDGDGASGHEVRCRLRRLTAWNGRDPERDHRLHTKSGEDQKRSEIASGFNPSIGTAQESTCAEHSASPSPCSIKLRRLLLPEETLRDKGRRHRSRRQRDKMILVPLCHRQERQNNCNSSKESGHRGQKPLELCSCTDETLDCGTCLETKPFNYALSGH
jgi:hypothetical protein